MKKVNKKGFTLVELVIVIAVIAILAAVLIPTFATVIEKGKRSAALQAVRNEMTEAKVAMAISAVTFEDGTVFEKDGYKFTLENGELKSVDNASTSGKFATTLDNGVKYWASTGAVLNIAASEDGWNAVADVGQKFGVGVKTGAKTSMTGHTITIKNDDGKVIATDSGADASCTYGFYDGKTNIGDYGKGYFTYTLVITTATSTDTYTGVFFIK